MGTGSFPGVKSGRGVTLTPHPLLVPWSWRGRAIPLLPLWAVRPVQSLSNCTRVHFTLPQCLYKGDLYLLPFYLPIFKFAVQIMPTHFSHSLKVLTATSALNWSLRYLITKKNYNSHLNKAYSWSWEHCLLFSSVEFKNEPDAEKFCPMSHFEDATNGYRNASNDRITFILFVH